MRDQSANFMGNPFKNQDILVVWLIKHRKFILREFSRHTNKINLGLDSLQIYKYFVWLVWPWMIIVVLIYNLKFNSKAEMQIELGSQKGGDEVKKLGNYILGKTIGQGTFNKVKIARHIHSNEQVAIKLIEKEKIKSEADHNRLAKQLKILRKARHPNIIQLYQILEDHRYYYLVTEYSSRGEMFQHIVKYEKLTQFEASKFLQQLLNAIDYLHQLGVAHRDLKPQNILLDYKFNLKLIDFGLSGIFSKGDSLSTACGSPCYASPEMLVGKPYDPLKIDIWSAGIVLYAMCFGYLPFDHSQSVELFRLIKQGKYEIPDHASEELKSILNIILEVDPLRRATIDQIRKHKFCLNNPVPIVHGIIQGLSTIPYEQKIQTKMKEMGLETSELKHEIINNRHNDRTTAYHLLLQQDLRQKNETILNYFLSKTYIINRYKIIEKVKENYEKRLQQKLERLQQSRKLRQRSSSKKKRSKTTDRKYNTGLEISSKNVSKNLFNSPHVHKQKRSPETTKRKSTPKSKKVLKRS